MAKELVVKTFDPNQLFYKMVEFYQENKKKINPNTGTTQRIDICCEGSSRSGKTFDIYDLLIFFCDQFKKKRNLSIYVVRKTLKSCREIAYKEDFVKKLTLAGIYSTDYARNENQSPEYTLWGSTIKFIGLDGGEELGRSDIIYVNEALDINNQKTMDNLLMRCEMLGLFDWNPKYSKHFIYKWEGRFNTLFTRTTFRDNKHIDPKVKGNILSKCPWSFDDYDEEKRCWKVPIEQRRPNEYNIKNGTANYHDWMVYGEGIRCPEEGAVFKNINWIETFPDDCESVHFGLDFGYTSDPSVLTKVGRKGNNIYIQYLTYNPYDNTDMLYKAVMPFLLEEQKRRKKESNGLETAHIIVACDSADRYKDVHFVRELNAIIINENKKIQSDCEKAKIDPENHKIRGIQFIKVKKPMVTVRLSNMKKFNLHVVETPEAVEEFDNYVYMIIEGNQTNIPIDDYNHGIDSAGYCIWHFHKWK